MAEPMDLLFSTPKMSTAFSPEAHVQGMLTMALAPHIGNLRRNVSSRRSAIVPRGQACIFVKLPWRRCTCRASSHQKRSTVPSTLVHIWAVRMHSSTVPSHPTARSSRREVEDERGCLRWSASRLPCRWAGRRPDMVMVNSLGTDLR